MAEEYHISPREVIDFSAAINPWGYSFGVVEVIKNRLESIFHYPDPECRKLTFALSEHLGAKPGMIVAGNGATEIIYLAMKALKPQRAVIPVPVFTEYERALRLAGGRPEFLYLKETDNFTLDIDRLMKRAREAQMIVLCNPNNPTGGILPGGKLQKIVVEAEKMGKIVMLDESFIDLQPHCSLVESVRDNDNLFILRSFTKFFSIAGLRLGYGIGGERLMAKVKSVRQPWTVNSLAQVAGIHIVKNMKKVDELREKIEKEREFLFENFNKIKGIKPYPSRANFILLNIEAPFSSSDLTCRLAKKGILVRDCSNFQGLSNRFIRVAVRKRGENEKLLYHLSQVVGERI